MNARRNVGREFLMSTEWELQTSVLSRRTPHDVVLDSFFKLLWDIAPSLPGPAGLFNGYGRIYFDCGHVELAICECSSPLQLPAIVERQCTVVLRAVEALAREGHELLLANNNSNGLLSPDATTWGSHENYLTELHPQCFGAAIIPFLASRIFAGSGGIDVTGGAFLAGARPTRMQLVTGGSTTERRAIHSTSREEHHLGESPSHFRYHLILGDGHRSHYNLALQFATTALTLKAICFLPKLRPLLESLAPPIGAATWVDALHRWNVLERAGESWRVDPMVLDIQRLYWDAATKYAEALDGPPSWIPWALQQWARTLDALEKRDLDWLSQRLDAFAKYRVYAAILASRRKTWADLTTDVELANEIALLDQSYHAFCRSDSLFFRLERAGLIHHRLQPFVEPGCEPEPYVPQVNTRADARARLIRERKGERSRLQVDWGCVYDLCGETLLTLHQPFATEFAHRGRVLI